MENEIVTAEHETPKAKRPYTKKNAVNKSETKVKGKAVEQVIDMLHTFCTKCDDAERGALLELAHYFEAHNDG